MREPPPVPSMVQRTGLWAVWLLVAGCQMHPPGSEATLPGRELFEACAACHEASGAGNRRYGAPAIAGLPAWYLEAQLTKFRVGLRGAHPDDEEGLRMRPMSRQLRSEEEVKAVAAYVAGLAPVRPAPTLGGDAAAGAASWVTCQACHGPAGLGQEALKAPPLAGQADWYLLRQLKKFKAGVRGADPRDVSGATMRPMSMTLPSEEAMRNVVAYVTSLGAPGAQVGLGPKR